MKKPDPFATQLQLAVVAAFLFALGIAWLVI